jgi:hypothetical protein
MAAEAGAPSEFARLFGNVTARLGGIDIARLTNRRRDELVRGRRKQGQAELFQGGRSPKLHSIMVA